MVINEIISAFLLLRRLVDKNMNICKKEYECEYIDNEIEFYISVIMTSLRFNWLMVKIG